jgi:hypothetical protein
LVRLGAISDEFQRAYWRSLALGLIQRLFPRESLPQSGSWEWVFRHLLGMIERANLFALDWQTLDYLWDWWHQYEYDEDIIRIPQPEWMMAEFLYGPPVRFYNHSMEMWYEHVAYDQPLLWTVAQFVRNDIELKADTLIGWEIYDNEVDLVANARRAVSMPEPYCWLPLLVDYVRGATGNPLLDEYVDLTEFDFEAADFNWGQLEQVKAYSKEAQAAWEKIEKLCDFAGDDMQPVMEVLLHGATIE